MPIGVPIRVASVAIITLPTMALSRPPVLPGGGVIWVNMAMPMPPRPFWNRVNRIQTSQNRPKAMASTETVRLKALMMRRRV